MKGNEDKCHLLFFSTDETVQVKVGTALSSSCICDILLAVKIDNMGGISKNPGTKLNSFSSMAQYISPELKSLIINTFSFHSSTIVLSYCFLRCLR